MEHIYRVFAAVLTAWVVSATAQQHDVPQILFDSVPNPIQMPRDMYLGEVSGVALNSKGHIFVLSRGNTSGPAYAAAATQLMEFDAKGKFIREIGKGLYAWSYAHMVRVDKDDNVWVTDKGSDMVISFDPAGHVRMVFGRKQEASDKETGPLEHPSPPLAPEVGRFRQVTDMAWDPQGNVYISDGYINSRVAKADRDGNWLKSWGERGNKPGELHTPHSIAADVAGNIYVADRGNRRIQVFDGEGKVLRIIKIDVPVDPGARPAIGSKPDMSKIDDPSVVNQLMMPGSPWVLCITPPVAGKPQTLFASDAFPGRIYKMTLDGQVLGVLGESGKQLKQFGWIHGMACPNENTLYVGELLNWRVQKLLLHPLAAK
jgi:sugar lactone lactonase YvrE